MLQQITGAAICAYWKHVLVCTIHDGQKHSVPDNSLSSLVPDLPLHTLEPCPRSLINDDRCRRENRIGPELVVDHKLLAGVRVEQQELHTFKAWLGAVAKSSREPQDHRMWICQSRAGSAFARCDVYMHNFVQQDAGRHSLSECIHRSAARGLTIQSLPYSCIALAEKHVLSN